MEVKNLATHFYTEGGIVKAVDGVSYDLNEGETLALVGESGCGKSVSALSVMRLIPNPPGQIVDGEVIFEGEDLLKVDLADMRKIRGNRIAMIFQEPMTSLNPLHTVAKQISETLIVHKNMSRTSARERTLELLRLVQLPDPEQRLSSYPHELSGGQRQRVMIAMALSCNPSLLIADEPTTALDVTIQAQVLDLMKSLQEELGMAIMMITHDLGVIADIADEVVVMYAGKVVERGSLDQIFDHPLHPYTKGLLASIPELGAERQKKLYSIPGTVPRPLAMPPGCAFAPRCQEAFSSCQELPPLELIEGDHATRCWLHLLTERI